MKLALAFLAALILAASASAATTPTVAWSKKDIQAAARALSYPKPHPKKLSCRGRGDGSGGRYVSFRCVATYRHHRQTRFLVGGIAVGGWLCAGKAGCKPLRRGFVTTAAADMAGSLGAAADLASRGYLASHNQIPYQPVHFCEQTGASVWACPFTIGDSERVTVTVRLKKAKGGYITSASTS